MVQAGERQGPCANPGCKKHEGTRLAQWTRIYLDKILATITEDDLKRKLQAFEQAQQETRDEAIAAGRSSARRPPRRRKAEYHDIRGEMISCDISDNLYTVYIWQASAEVGANQLTGLCRALRNQLTTR